MLSANGPKRLTASGIELNGFESNRSSSTAASSSRRTRSSLRASKCRSGERKLRPASAASALRCDARYEACSLPDAALSIPQSCIHKTASKRTARRKRESISQMPPSCWSSRSGTQGTRLIWVKRDRRVRALDEGDAFVVGPVMLKVSLSFVVAAVAREIRRAGIGIDHRRLSKGFKVVRTSGPVASDQYLTEIALAAVLPLADAREAHLMPEGGRPRPKGKIVLAVRAS